jgi:WD40 repeat protein
MKSTAPGKSANPFPGLRPFRESEEHLFFGRESQVDTMIDKLARTRFLAVVGTSGSGKSSLVNCGLRPALHRGLMADAGTSWRIAQFRPGSDPIWALAGALAADRVLFGGFQSAGLPLKDIIEASLRMSKLGLVDVYRQAQLSEGVNLLVIADQFEELFRYRRLGTASADSASERGQEAKAFVSLLLEAAVQADLPIYVVLTMRSDFLGDCAEFPGFPEALNQSQYLVPRLTRDERREAIAGPVGVGSGEISTVLLTRLVNDVGDNPDQLSILQHALNRTWARWQNEEGAKVLELPHYEAIGTMAHALDHHAEKAYSELPSGPQKRICENVFKALTDKGTDARGIRRPMELSALCAAIGAEPAEVTPVIDVFRRPSRSFLMPPMPEPLEAGTVIDISHESLMRVWERLKAWADEEARSARLYRRLSETAVLHTAGKAGLWRDPDLQLALDWREREKPTKPWAELYGGGFEGAMNFLEQSEAQRQAEVRDGEERQKQQLAAKRARWLASGSALVVLIFAGLGMYAWNQRNEAIAASKTAQSERKEAQRAAANAKAAQDVAEDEKKNAEMAREDADRQRAIADHQKEEANKQRTKAEELEREAEKERDRDREEKGKADSLRFAIIAKDIATAGDTERGILMVQEAARATSRYGYLLPEAEQVLRQTVQALRLLRTEDAPRGTPLAVAFDPDGMHLSAVSSGGTWLLDTESGKAAKIDLPAGLTHITAGPSGKYLAAVTADAATVRLWDMSNGARADLKHTAAVTSMVFSRDGRYLAAANRDGATLWSVPSDATPLRRFSPGAAVIAIALSRDGKYLATASNDPPPDTSGTVQIWDTANNEAPLGNTSVMGRVSALELSDDGQLAAIVSGVGQDASLTTWERPGSQKGENKPPSIPVRETVSKMYLRPDGCELVTMHSNGAARIWRIPRTAGNQCAPAFQQQIVPDVRLAAFSADGKRLATASSDRRVFVRDAATGAELFVISGHPRDIASLTFNPDGRRLATVSLDGKIRVWSAAPGDTLLELAGHKDTIYRVAFSPDGTRIATASWDKTAIVWDASSGKSLKTLSGHTGEVLGVAFNLDGTRITTASADKTAKIWDSSSGQELLTLTGHTDRVMAVVFSPDGRRLATASWDKTVKIWDAGTGRELLTLAGHKERVEHVTFSPDGKSLATASSDRTAKIWDVSTGAEKFTLAEHKSAVVGVAFDPRGGKLATASADRTAIVWDTASGKSIRTLSGHRAIVRSVAFSPDGRVLATVSEDGTAILWQSDSGAQIGTLAGNTEKSYGIAFSADGSRVATSNAGGRASVYAANAKTLMDVARGRVTRLLTATECTDYSVKSEQCDAAIEAEHLVQRGRDEAREGELAQAEADFKSAQELNPDLKLDQKEPARLAANHWFDAGRQQVDKGDVASAMTNFQTALRLYPSVKDSNPAPAQSLVAKGTLLVRQNKLKEGTEEISKAVAVYTGVKELDPSGRLRGEAWNELCWFGSLQGHAGEVLDECEKAVQLEPDDWSVRDSRGLARALAGDVKGAIEDFQFYAGKSDNDARKRQRQGWVNALRQGQNPFTPDLIEQLFGQ